MKINIKGQNYKIKVVNKLEENVVALCDPINKIIYLLKERTQKQKIYDLSHEIVHAAFNETGIDQVVSSELQEIIAETVGSVFAKLIKPVTAK